MSETTPPTTIPNQLPAYKETVINGQKITIGRLTPTKATALFYELTQGLIPALGDLADRFTPGAGGALLKGSLKLEGLGNVLDRLMRHLTPAKFALIAEQALASTTCGGQPIWPQIDAIMGSSLNYQKLVYQSLAFQYADFVDALGGLPASFRGPLSEALATWKQ